MKIFKQILFLSLLAVLMACSEDMLVPQSEELINAENNSVDLISMVVPDIEMDATTRSKLFEDGDGLKFTWQENDEIGVVPMSGRPLSFPIHAENAGKNTALFDGGSWALKSSEKYAAFFPIDAKNQKTDISHITIDYTGQMQGNYTDYDFLATGAVKPSNGQVTFNMKRLSAILKISISMPAGGTARYGKLIAPSPVFGLKGTLDLSGNEPVYTPEIMTKYINTDLGGDRTSASAWNYTIYMMIPPTDLSGETLSFRLTSDAGYAYEATLTGKNFEAGKAYQLSGAATGAVIKNASLITAAENATNNPEVGTFTKNTDGSVDVNENVDKITKVVRLNLSWKNSPTICEEIGYFRNLKELECIRNEMTSLDISNNTALTYLKCAYNKLASLDVSNNKALTKLECYWNYNLTSLDVSNCTALTRLDCYSNPLTSLDVSNCSALTRLDCLNCQLTSLDVSSCTALTYLQCASNKLTSLDVSNNTALTSLYCNSNQLTSLDVSNCTALTNLQCYSNPSLTTLDVSDCTALTSLACFSNQLTSLDVSNNLALEYLGCYSNQLTSLDVSNNTALTQLSGHDNQLTSLDVSNNTALRTLYCGDNQLTSLDVSNNTALGFLSCGNNPLTSLDISNNTTLKELYCPNDQLTSLDVSNNKELTQIDCSGNLFRTVTIDTGSNGLNKLIKLTIENCTKLEVLDCYPSDYNNGTSGSLFILLVSGCTKLEVLNCGWNLISELDVSTNTALCWGLTCHNNRLSSLNIGNCTNLKLSNVFCGSQWNNDEKTESKTMKLYVSSSNTGTFNESSAFNSGVEIVTQ